MLEFLVVLFILSLVFGSVFKISFGIMKFVLSIIGGVILITLVPVFIALVIPLLLIGLGFGFLKAIF